MEQLLDTIAANYSRVDKVAERDSSFELRLSELLEKPDEREPITWESAGAYIDLKMSQLMKTPPNRRLDEWRRAMEAIISAAVAQSQDELVLKNILRTAHSGAERMKATSVSLDEARDAAAVGIGKDRFDKAKNGKSKQQDSSPNQ